MTSPLRFGARRSSPVRQALLVFVLLSATPPLSLGGETNVVAVDPVSFKHAGILDVWSAYAGKLTFGKGQTLALLDDGCKLSMPEWSQSDGPAPKVLATWNSVDGNDDPKHVGRGYHGSTIGMPSSLNYRGKRGVAFNNQLAVVRALECCHCNVKDSKTLAAGLQWVIDNHAKHRITAVNLAPVDDLEHATPVPTAIDARLKRLHELGIWVSAPAGNHNFTKGISWPACQPHCFAVGAVRPGKDEVYLDRSAKIDLVVPAAATSSSNAILCGGVQLLREAIDLSKYDWKKDGATLPDAMMAIFQRTGVAVRDPGTDLTFRRLHLKAALDEVFRAAGQARVPELLKREVSREGVEYLEKLRKRTPFGTNDFNLTALRTGMGSRRLPTIKGVMLSKVKIGEIPAEWVLASGADPEVRLLYLHGGGFVSGSGAYYLAQAAHISAAAGCAVLLPDYRLAPEHRFPAGLDDCVLSHRWMRANGPAGPAPARATFVAGDSAGGSLALATLLALRDRKMPLPAGGIALSPTTDLTLSSASLKTVHDPIISAKTMPIFRDHYLGSADPKHPLASPVFGDYRELPPLLIQAGEHEMLRDDSIRVAKKARADGIAVRLEVWPGMFHVFQSHEPLLPEARDAIAHLAEFMRSALPPQDAPITVAASPKAGGHIHPSICRANDGTLVVVYKGPQVLMRTRSKDGGKTWEAPEAIATSAKRPEAVREVKTFEVYPGTADTLPDGRLIVTWNYIADDRARDGYYERALLYTLSSDQGRTWSEQKLIGPVAGKHLGAVRHNVLPWSEGRWLLPLRDGPPRLFDPKAGTLATFPVREKDGKQLEFQQILRTPRGTLLALGPVLLRSTDEGKSWAEAANFPASDPARDNLEGRYLTALSDGRVLVTWGVGTANKGLRYNFSADDGKTWNTGHTVTLLPETSIAARYYSARTIQLDDQHVGTVYLSGSTVYFLKVRIDRLARAKEG